MLLEYFQDFTHREDPVPLAVRLVEGRVGHAVGAVFAIEAVLLLHDAFLDGGGHQEGLEGGAGVEAVRDGLVALVVRRGARVGVRVENGTVGHGEDLTRAGVHDDDETAAGAGPENGLLQVRLHGMLDAAVEGEDKAQLLVLLACHGALRQVELLPPGVTAPEDLLRLSPEVAVVAHLEALEAVGVHAHEADQMAGQFLVRVEALGFLDQVDPLHLEVLDLFGLGGGDHAGDPAEILRFRDLLGDRLFGLTRHGGQLCGRLFDVVDLGGVGEDGVGEDARGKLLAVSIEDDPSLGVELEGFVVLLIGKVLVGLPRHDLEVEGPEDEHAEQHQEHRQQGGDPEAEPFSRLRAHLMRTTCSRSGY